MAEEKRRIHRDGQDEEDKRIFDLRFLICD
jgi:hypothetical protein